LKKYFLSEQAQAGQEGEAPDWSSELFQLFNTRAGTNVNGLEFLAAVVLLVHFQAPDGFQTHAMTIDHKLNLLLVLFDLR